MNIGLFTDTFYPEINGVANSAYQLSLALKKRGHQVYVFTVSNPSAEKEDETVYRMGSVPFLLLKDRRVSYSLPQFWTKKVAALSLDVIHTQTEFTVGNIGCQIAKKLEIPLIHTYHTLYEEYTHYLKVPGNENFKGMIQHLSRKYCDRAQTVIVPTNKVKTLLKGYGVKPSINVLPTGINVEKFENYDDTMIESLKKSFNLNNEDHILVSIGRLSQEKNLAQLIDLVDKLCALDEHVKLLIVGDGPEKDHLMKMSAEKGLTDHIIFAGEVAWDRIENYYALGDVFVSASQSETQGLTYLEALSAGKPLLVRKDDCLNDILIEGCNGYAYETEAQFQSAFTKLFSNHSYSEMKAFSQEIAHGISMEAFGRGAERIYENVVSERSILLEGCELDEQIHSVVG